MKRLIATALLSAGLGVAGCSNGGHGTVGSADLNLLNGNPGGGTPPAQPTSSTALFHPAAGVLPYPSDLYFAGSTDGTLNIQPPNALMPNQAAVNALDGFSTNAVIRERFGGALDPTSFNPATVIIIPVKTDNATKATIGVLGPPLTLGTDFAAGVATDAGVGATILEITPRHPLQPSTCLSGGQFLGANCKTGTGYLVFLTNGIKDVSGNAAVPDTDYANIKTALAGGATCPSIADATLNAICRLTGAHLAIAQAVAQQIPALANSLSPANIVLSFSFTTESTVDTLALMSATATAQAFKANPTGINTKQANAALAGHADIYVGVLTIPYYLSKSAPLTGYWNAPPFPLDPTSTFVTRYNPLPVPTQMLRIPVLITVPNANSAYALVGGPRPPPGGWPVLMYQHGVVVNREFMLPVADSFADAGFMVVAIDLPLHGVTNKTDPLYATDANPAYTGLIPPGTGSIERTFDLDLNTNSPDGFSVIPGSPPDGVVDPTGSHYLNLQSPLTARDNFRESAADLMTVLHSLPNLAQSGLPVDMTRIHYLGHSMGGIVGTMFMAVTPPGAISTATLANPGGNWALLAQTSPSFSPLVLGTLKAGGLEPGMTLFAQFFRDIQTIVDSGDPINYIGLTTAQHPVHVMQVVGTIPAPAGCSPSPPIPGCPDQTVPNPATQALITASAYGPAGAAGTLTRITARQAPVVVNAGGIRGYVNFTDGYHASLIDPRVSQAVTVEMQTEAISFTGVPIPPAGIPANTPGSTLLLANPTVIQP
jgi:pimeloyl-ACP methyl ester carboxylesterase